MSGPADDYVELLQRVITKRDARLGNRPFTHAESRKVSRGVLLEEDPDNVLGLFDPDYKEDPLDATTIHSKEKPRP